MKRIPFHLTQDGLETIVNNFYDLGQQFQEDNAQQLQAFVDYASHCRVQIQSGELEEAKKNYFHILFDHVFRTLQSMMYDRWQRGELLKLVDLHTGELLQQEDLSASYS